MLGRAAGAAVVGDYKEGITRLDAALAHRKLLLVLDNVWVAEQLEWLVPLLGDGSRVVVTTRNEALLMQQYRRWACRRGMLCSWLLSLHTSIS